MQSIVDFIQANLDFNQLKFLAGFIGFNLVIAVAAGIKTSNFQLAKLGEFLYKKLLPFLLLYITASLLGNLIGFGELANTAFVALLAILTADLTDSLAQFGIKLPDFLVKPETQRKLSIEKTINLQTENTTKE
jgi:hypothetical protein